MSTIEVIKDFLKDEIKWQKDYSEKTLDMYVKHVAEGEEIKARNDNAGYMISGGKLTAYQEILRLIESLENNK